LVGDAGSGKNTAKNIAVHKLIMEEFPDIPVSAAVTSREDVSKFMGSEENLKSFRYPDGSIEEYRPFFFAVNELANLLSVDFRKMVDFLVDLYDSMEFSTSFKHDTVKDKIKNPCATMLACGVPDWFMRSLKMDLFTGGFGRRLNIVYENRTILKAEPCIPAGGEEAWQRVVNHMKAARELVGEVRFSDATRKWWIKWYENDERLKSDDLLLRQNLANKHVMLQKLAILLALDTMPFNMVVEVEHFEKANAMLELLETPIKKLSAGIGRNELAAVSVQVLETIRAMGGRANDRKLRAMFFRDCRVNGNEYNAMINHLSQTDQIFVENIMSNGRVEMVFFLPDAYRHYKAN